MSFLDSRAGATFRARHRFVPLRALRRGFDLCHRGLGKLYRRIGKRKQAREHLTIATAMYCVMDMRFWLEQAEAELMELGV